MLSKRHNEAILHAKGVPFPSCLMYLDFSISAQNKAWTNTAKCCQGLLLEEYPLVVDALPVLSSRMINDDKKSVDINCLTLSRLANSYKHNTKKLTESEGGYPDQPTAAAGLPAGQPQHLHLVSPHPSHLRQRCPHPPGPQQDNKQHQGSRIYCRDYSPVTNSLVSELLTGLPGDRVFAVDALLCSPGIIVKDHVVCQ